MAQTKQAQLLGEIGAWMKSIQEETEKSASEMGTTGSAKSDPGSIGGKSTHPSVNVDNGTRSTPLGERAKENERDVKQDEGPASVDSGPSNDKGSQDDVQMQVGMSSKSTGKDPANEKPEQDRFSDPGTSHPANMSHGEKYSSLKDGDLLKSAELLCNELLAGIAVGNTDTKPVGTKAAEVKPETVPAEKAAETGSDLASIMGITKEAADELATRVLEHIIHDAVSDADRVASYLAQTIKKAEGMPPVAPEELAALGAAGGPPPGANAPPGAPPMGMPGEPSAGPAAGGAPPDAAGGGGGHEQALQQLAMALMELGISPEELEQMLAGQTGKADQSLAGGPPAGEPPADAGAKIAAAVKQHKRSGKFKFEEAKEGSEQRKLRNQMKSHILELTGSR